MSKAITLRVHVGAPRLGYVCNFVSNFGQVSGEDDGRDDGGRRNIADVTQRPQAALPNATGIMTGFAVLSMIAVALGRETRHEQLPR
jgi:hypothetical protein